jgi:tetratricopeptide (TPR) repeat protein
MDRIIRRAATAALFASAASLAILVPAAASAQDYSAAPAPAANTDAAPAPARANPNAKAPPKPTIGAKVGKPLIDGQKAYNAGDVATALAKAQEADAIMPKTPFEEYNIAKLIGVIYVKGSQFEMAAAQFNRAIATGAMPDEDRAFMYSTAQLLNYNAKDYKKSIQNGIDSSHVAALTDQAELVMLQSYYFDNDFAGAEKYGQDVVAAKKAAGKKPTKEILETLINAQIKLNNQTGAHATLEQLVTVDPSPENWGRVIDQAFAGNITDHQGLNLFRLRLLTKAMSAQDYLGMASVDLKLGLPGEAKDVLQKGINSGALTDATAKDLLAQATPMMAKDQAALAQFEKVALAAKDGEADVKLGESYWTYGRAADGEAAIQRGIMKGVKDTADAQMTLGIVLLSEGKKDEAAKAFAQAAQTPNSQNTARVWGLYAQN